MKSSLMLPIALILSNVSGLAISLLVPFLVDTSQYSTFALCWGVGQLISSLSYEWLRFSVLRYSVGADETLALNRRSIILSAYLIITAALLIVSLLLLLANDLISVAAGISVVTLYAACQGLFDGRQALSRARLDNGFYSTSWIVRTFLSLVFSILIAKLTGSGLGALTGLAISYPITMVLMNRGFKFQRFSIQFDGEQLNFLARYGLFAAFASNLSLFLPTVLRSLAIAALGLDNSAGLLLAVDLSTKAIAVVGLAVNIILMQQSIRAAEFGSEREIDTQVSLQVSITAAFVIPAAVGFYLIQKSFVSIFISQQYLPSYSSAIGLSCLAAGLICLRQFSLDSLFVALGRTTGAVLGPLCAVLATVLFANSMQFFGRSSPEVIAAAYALGGGVALIVAGYMVTKIRRIVWPIIDLVKIATSSLFMILCGILVPQDYKVISLVFTVLVGGAAYGATSLVLNVAGFRLLVGEIFKR